MIYTHSIDRVALNLFGFELYWYGLTYIFGFLFCYLFFIKRINNSYYQGFLSKNQVQDLLTYCIFGVIIGGRLGYVFIYDYSRLLEDPLWVFNVREGGMSFHGGLIGTIVAGAFFAYSRKTHPIDLMDFIAPAVPIGLCLGRIGNFINAEHFGYPTGGDWGVVFPFAGDFEPRHPAQLYEAFLEGILLFIVLVWFSSKKRFRYGVSIVFLVGYAIGRFISEFYRVPDGFVLDSSLSIGQGLSLVMILAALLLYFFGYRKQVYFQPAAPDKPQGPKKKAKK